MPTIMNKQLRTPTGILLFIVALACLVISLVVQLGESIRYGSGGVPLGSQTYTWMELVFLFGLPGRTLVNLLQRAARRHGPNHLDLITAHANYLVKQITDHTTVVGNNRHPLPYLRLTRTLREVYVAVLLRLTVITCFGIFQDQPVSLQSQQI